MFTSVVPYVENPVLVNLREAGAYFEKVFSGVAGVVAISTRIIDGDEKVYVAYDGEQRVFDGRAYWHFLVEMVGHGWHFVGVENGYEIYKEKMA